jgi:hypothetical protein
MIAWHKQLPVFIVFIQPDRWSGELPLWERACSRKRFVSDLDIEGMTAFASKPAPTVDLWSHANSLRERAAREAIERAMQ